MILKKIVGSIIISIFLVIGLTSQVPLPDNQNRKTENTPDNFPLNQITSLPVAAYSVRKLHSLYTGAALRVIRLSDSQEFDLPTNFSKSDADSIALSGNLKVIKLYDQSGNGRDIYFSQNSRPGLAYLSKPMIDFGWDGSLKYGATNSALDISQPQIFAAVDAPFIGGELNSFGDGLNFATKVENQKFAQFNGSTLFYAQRSNRGTVQLTSTFQKDIDGLRRNSLDLFCENNINAGDDPAYSVRINIGGNPLGQGFVGRIGEIIIFEDAVSEPERNFLEADQQHYFVDGNRLIIHGDSLGYGYGINVLEEERFNYGAVAREILGDGYDIYKYATPGHDLQNLIPQVRTVIQPLLRTSAASNIILLNSGWNDVSAGINEARLKREFIRYGDAVREINAGNTRIAVSSLPVANYIYQDSEYPTIRANINSWMAANYFFFANKYIDTTDNPFIGNNANTLNTKYYTSDRLHLNAGGYNEWGKEAAADLPGINSDLERPTTPANLTINSIIGDAVTLSWKYSKDNVGIGGYRLQYSSVPDFTSNVSNKYVLAGTGNSATVFIPPGGITYYFRIASVDRSGNYSFYSSSVIGVNSSDTNFWEEILGTYRADENNDIIGTSNQIYAARSYGRLRYAGDYYQKTVDSHSYPVQFGVFQNSLKSDSVYIKPDGTIFEKNQATNVQILNLGPGAIVRFELNSSGNIVVKVAVSRSTNFSKVWTSRFTYANTESNGIKFFLGARGDAQSDTLYKKPTLTHLNQRNSTQR